MLGLAARYGTRGLRVVSVTFLLDPDDAEERTAINDAIHEEHMTYPCFLDVRSAWSRLTQLNVRPSFMVLDRNGRVAYRATAVLEPGGPDVQRLDAAVAQALDAH